MDPVGFHHFHKSCFQEHLKVLESKYLQERLTLCSALMGSSLVHADPVTTCQDVTRQTLQFLKVAVPMAGLNEHEGRSEPYPDHKVSLLTVWNLTTTAQLIVVSVPLNAVTEITPGTVSSGPETIYPDGSLLFLNTTQQATRY